VAGFYFVLGSGMHGFPLVRRDALAAPIGFVVIALTVSYLIDFQRRTLLRALVAEEELKRSNEELLRAIRDLEAFAYSASHDLQEPLRNIALSAQLLSRDWGAKLVGNDAMFLETILKSAQRMNRLVADLLTYTRVARAEEQAPVPVDANRIFADVLETLRDRIAESRATVIANHLPSARIHPAQLSQLFQNLLSNALKYCGTEPPRIEVSGKLRDGCTVFSVSDNGIGVEAKYAEQIFGLFKRLHTRDKYPGSGMGLAICQRVVERYGGRIWLEQSTLGRGSVFCFSLPLDPE